MTEITNASESLSFWHRAEVGGRLGLANQSGLPLLVSAAGPVPPQMSRARVAQLRAKRAIDLVGAVTGLVVLSPVLLAAAIAIKSTSSGPVFFSQPREGLNGRAIRVVKFRTMASGRGDASGVQQTTVGDDRITPVGRFLRKTNIDELPQLLNVLTGDMSLVGPRPHPFNMRAAGVRYDEHVPYYSGRLCMKPGITGWAQCHGLRGPTEDGHAAKARIDHDLAYVQNFSLLLDLKIVWKTFLQEAAGGTGV